MTKTFQRLNYFQYLTYVRNTPLRLTFHTFILVILTSVFLSFQSAASIIYVDLSATGNQDGTSWQDAHTDLRAAMIAAIPGDEIWVTADMYKPTNTTSRDSTFDLRDQVSMFGGFLGGETNKGQRLFSNRTILSGNIGLPNDSTDNSFHVCWVSNWFVEMTLDGFILEDGNAETSSGGAVYTHKGYITFINCIFRRNYSLYGGAICSTESHMSYTNCDFISNRGYWGGAYQCWGGTDDVFYNCTFENNQSILLGGGITAQFASDISLENCAFTANRGSIGGAISIEHDGNVMCLNCIFNGNAADTGAAIAIIDSGSIELYNSTLAQNWAMSTAGALYLPGGVSAAIIYNSIIYNNTSISGAQSIDANPAQLTVLYTLSDMSISGTGNLQTDPLFIDQNGADNIAGNSDDNFHLQANSPGINGGDSLLIPLDVHDRNANGDTTERFPYDMDGFQRISSTSVDMGPFEASGIFGIGQLSARSILLGNVFPNPSNGNCGFSMFLNQAAVVEITLLDIHGKRHETLLIEDVPSGTTFVELKAVKYSPGICFLHIAIGDNVYLKKMVLY